MSRESTPEARERREQERGAAKARAERVRVADQLRALILESDSTGSAPLVATRFSELVIAERSGDPFLIRGAAVELARAAALYTVRVDLRQGRSAAPVPRRA